MTSLGDRLDRRAAALVLATLGALVVVAAPGLGSEPWRFRTLPVVPHGVLAPVVRAADKHWDLGFVRTPAMLAGLLVAGAFVALCWVRLPRWLVLGCALAVMALLLVPATLLQVGLRQATAPWQYDNDSTYQIELAGDLVLHGHEPYGHDYRDTSLRRWYADVRPQPPRPYVALDHLAYFPGTPLLAAVWRLLPAPLDDVRVLVLLATFGTFFAMLLFDAPWPWRVAAGAFVAANPLAVRAAWFGTSDTPSVLALLLAFAFATRRRYVAAGVALGCAILLKQFALVAVPFLAVLVWRRTSGRDAARAGVAAGAVIVAGALPFLVADPRALVDDTIAYGGSTYRIVGYGLSNLLVNAGVIGNRFGSYPFVPLVLLVWAPVTVALLVAQWRRLELWTAPAGFAASIFVLFFISRVFQTSYLIWPLAAIATAVLVASGERPTQDRPRPQTQRLAQERRLEPRRPGRV